MKLPGIDGGSGLAPAMEGLLMARRERAPRPLPGRVHPDRALSAVADAAYSVGPALVFAAAGVDTFDWGDGAIFAAAFAAQVVVDLAVSTVREWAALGVSPRLQAAVLIRVYA